MNSYKTLFAQKKTVLIPFFVIGDPDEQTSLELVKTAIDAGADALELGIPFSDPVADGPTIQKADIRSLAAGMTPAKAIAFIAKVSAYKPIPIGLLVYYNLVFQYGVEQFFADFHSAGGTSVLIADLSIDDAEEILPAVRKARLETVFMATPNTPDQRLRRTADLTTGFIYTVSVLGTTGQRTALSASAKPLVERIKSITDKPVCVGFGISTPEHAAAVAQTGANGVIIGSKIVAFIEDNLGNADKMKQAIADFIRRVKTAIDK